MQGIVANVTYLTCKGSTESAHLYLFFSKILHCSLYNLERVFIILTNMSAVQGCGVEYYISAEGSLSHLLLAWCDICFLHGVTWEVIFPPVLLSVGLFIHMATISIKVCFSAAVLAVSAKPCIALICPRHTLPAWHTLPARTVAR